MTINPEFREDLVTFYYSHQV